MLVAVEQAGCSGAGIWQVIKSRYISEKVVEVRTRYGVETMRYRARMDNGPLLYSRNKEPP